ncbi:hypothetical protein Lal_00020956 [Lupinus albus]|nr:hypothetical protein Lal_00020956 [Lupinus albus]
MAATQNHKHKETHNFNVEKHSQCEKSRNPKFAATVKRRFSHLRQRFANRTVQIEEPDVTNTQSKFEPDQTIVFSLRKDEAAETNARTISNLKEILKIDEVARLMPAPHQISRNILKWFKIYY